MKILYLFIVIFTLALSSCCDVSSRNEANPLNGLGHENRQQWQLKEGIADQITTALEECRIGIPYLKFLEKLAPFRIAESEDVSGPLNNMRGGFVLIDGRKIGYAYDATSENAPLVQIYYIGYQKDGFTIK